MGAQVFRTREYGEGSETGERAVVSRSGRPQRSLTLGRAGFLDSATRVRGPRSGGAATGGAGRWTRGD